MNQEQEEIFQAQLNQERANIKKSKVSKSPSKKTGIVKSILKNPSLETLFAYFIELSPIGLFPTWTILVISTWYKEKKSGIPPNIAEYLMVGGLAIISDILDILDITGFGIIITRMIDIPTLGLLWLWRINKHGLKPELSTKTKIKK